MHSNLNVLAINPVKDKQFEEILEKSLNTTTTLTRAVFKDMEEYDFTRFSGAAESIRSAFSSFYDKNKRHLKNIHTLEKYLEDIFLGDAEYEKKLKDAKNQSKLWLAIYMQSFVQKEIQALQREGASFITMQKIHMLKETLHQFEAEIFDYPWTKEDFLYFMKASLDTYHEELGSMQMCLVHMVQHGPGYILLKMEKEKNEKENSFVNKKTDALQQKNERKIVKLTEENKRYKEQIKSLQNKLSKKEYDSALAKQAAQKQAQMKEEYEKQISVLDAGFNQERKELLREIAMLRDKNNSLRNQLNQYQEILQEEKQIAVLKEPLDLSKYNVIFMGGHPNQINKLREKYPKWTYYIDESFNDRLPKDADFLVYFTSHCSHTLFHSMQSWNKTRKKPIYYAYANNLEQLEQAIQDFVYTEDSLFKYTLIDNEKKY